MLPETTVYLHIMGRGCAEGVVKQTVRFLCAGVNDATGLTRLKSILKCNIFCHVIVAYSFVDACMVLTASLHGMRAHNAIWCGCDQCLMFG